MDIRPYFIPENKKAYELFVSQKGFSADGTKLDINNLTYTFEHLSQLCKSNPSAIPLEVMKVFDEYLTWSKKCGLAPTRIMYNTVVSMNGNGPYYLSEFCRINPMVIMDRHSYVSEDAGTIMYESFIPLISQPNMEKYAWNGIEMDIVLHVPLHTPYAQLFDGITNFTAPKIDRGPISYEAIAEISCKRIHPNHPAVMSTYGPTIDARIPIYLIHRRNRSQAATPEYYTAGCPLN